MRPPRPTRERRRAQQARARQTQRLRRLIGSTLVAGAFGITLLLTAFSGSDTVPVSATSPAPAVRLLPAGRPAPQVVAVLDSLRLQLPVAQAAVTAVGYHASSEGALTLDPLGRRLNAPLFSRIARKLFGGGGTGVGWYQLSGKATDVLVVGAAPSTDVYSPVDGTVVGITKHVINGRVFGVRVDVQPSAVPSLVVSLTNLRADPALTVGSQVAASASKLGTVVDLSRVERQTLARYTQDAGNHVSVEVHPTATLALS